MKSNKNKYQVVLVLNPKMKEKGRDVLLKKIIQEVEKIEAKVVVKNHLGMKDFVYDIGGFEKGDFWIFEVEGQSGIKLDEMNVFLNREIKIIRYLILKV